MDARNDEFSDRRVEQTAEQPPHVEQERRLRELLEVAHGLVEAVAKGSSETDLLQFAVERAAELMHAKYAAIGVLDEQDRYRHFVHVGMTPEQVQAVGRPPRGGGVLGWPIEQRGSVRVNHLEALPRAAGFPPHHPRMETLLAVPLYSLGRAYGRLYLCDRLDGGTFTAFDELLASHLARYLSLALERGHRIEAFREKEADYNQGEERYRLLLDMAPGAVAVIQDDVFVMANAAAVELAGATRSSELIGRPVEELLHPESRAAARQRLAEMLLRARVDKIEVRILREDRSDVWVELEGGRIAYRGRPAVLMVGRNITREKQESRRIRALHRLTESVNRAGSSAAVLEAALDSLQATTGACCAAVQLFDSARTLRVVAGRAMPEPFGDALLATLGWTPSNIPSVPLVLADPQSEPALAPLHGFLREHTVASVTFVPVCHRHDVLGSFLLGYPQRHDAHEDEVHLALTIAEQVGLALVRQWAAERLARMNSELEERVRRRTRQLEEANKELEAFSYSVSHDLRAPLRTLDGYSRILLDDFGASLDATGKGHLERIIGASKRMERLIEDLLRLSGVNRSPIQLRRVDLSAIAEDIVAKLREAQPERRVAVRIVPGLTAMADAGLIQIALQNLLANAWKYTGRKSEAQIVLTQCEHSGKRCYALSDNGAGFDMTYAEKLFVPFQRLHPPSQFEGTGIGLALVSRIVRRHGGSIWAEAAPERGARFYFTLWEDGLPEEGAPRLKP